jgi:hypothetical protein
LSHGPIATQWQCCDLRRAQIGKPSYQCMCVLRSRRRGRREKGNSRHLVWLLREAVPPRDAIAPRHDQPQTPGVSILTEKSRARNGLLGARLDSLLVTDHVAFGSISTDAAGSVSRSMSASHKRDPLIARHRNDAMGHSTKSLRSSPLRGSKSREAGSRLRGQR